MLDLPRVIGHRGAAASAPENTLASIRTARQQGARWVEFDVKITRDGVPVLFHDDRLERTTNGTGRVRDHDLATMQALDAGAWFGSSFTGERVPTLAEALRQCVELGLGVNVEIKPCHSRAEDTTRAAIEVLRAGWPASSPPPLISSFSHSCLEIARALEPVWPRGYLCERLPWRWRYELQRYGATTLHASQRRLGARQIEAIVASGVPLLLYTVNEPARAYDLLEAGASAVFTDRVADVVAVTGA